MRARTTMVVLASLVWIARPDTASARDVRREVRDDPPPAEMLVDLDVLRDESFGHDTDAEAARSREMLDWLDSEGTDERDGADDDRSDDRRRR